MTAFTAAEIRRLRLASLLLAPDAQDGPASGGPAAIVRWFGAMQAQDLTSGKWSFGLRLPGATESDIDAAIERGEVLRTWPMRGTVHFVPPRDARWMLGLMGARALDGAAARRAYLGLSDAHAFLAADVLGQALATEGRMTRAACVAALEQAGIPTAGQHGYHLLWYVSQLGITCIGPNVGKEQTFVLLDQWAPDPQEPERDEALGIMAERYFQSHGPTTRQDFAGWMGMTAADAKTGIAVAGTALTTVTHDGRDLLMATGPADRSESILAAADTAAVHVLPGFDEFMLGFKDRSLMLDEAHKERIIPGGNGVFQPTLVRDGQVIGTWRRTLKKGRVEIQGLPFETASVADRAAFERAFADYGSYLGSRAEVGWG
ncbi:MAG TPA: winged helix DNA-binding domain-containing protein [Anaerolineae bacterium]|nr:winged helix DNA-binding domain-containing protein [Anaerolineae bacterium]